ncbi:MAG TPA: outer membrane lipoprotein chaperone LolA [Nitrospirota bacterium]
MKLFSAILFCIIFSSPAFALTPQEAAQRLQDSYDKTRDMKADFTQVSEVKAMNMTREGSGKLLIKKPGMLRYSYSKPEKQELIVRGDELVMYTPEVNQVITKRMERAVMDRTPSTFLAGLGRIADSFNPRFPKSGEKDAKGRVQLELVPKGDGMGVEMVLVTLDPDSFNIVGFTFTETSGNVNAISLFNIKINAGIKDSAFGFKIPKGATIIAQ